jgi:hypothetical protein
MLGAAAAVVGDRLRVRATRRVQLAAAATAAAAFVLLAAGTAARPLGERFPGERLSAFLPPEGCVRADAPTALIQLDVLSRDLHRGCPMPVDFTGLTYDKLARRAPDGAPLPRESNSAWQTFARDYLTSGSATVLVRDSENGFDATTQQLFRSLPVLGRVGEHAVLGPADPGDR